MFPSTGMLHNLISLCIILVSQQLRVPLNSDEAFFDEVFLQDGGVGWEDDATIAFLGPVAKGADVAGFVNGFQDERGECAMLVL